MRERQRVRQRKRGRERKRERDRETERETERGTVKYRISEVSLPGMSVGCIECILMVNT